MTVTAKLMNPPITGAPAGVRRHLRRVPAALPRRPR